MLFQVVFRFLLVLFLIACFSCFTLSIFYHYFSKIISNLVGSWILFFFFNSLFLSFNSFISASFSNLSLISFSNFSFVSFSNFSFVSFSKFSFVSFSNFSFSSLSFSFSFLNFFSSFYFLIFELINKCLYITNLII